MKNKLNFMEKKQFNEARDLEERKVEAEERKVEVLEKIASSASWVALWTFFLALGSCAGHAKEASGVQHPPASENTQKISQNLPASKPFDLKLM